MRRKIFGEGRNGPKRDVMVISTGVGVMPNGQTSVIVQHDLGMKPINIIINSAYESENYRMKSTFDTWTATQFSVGRQLSTSTGDVTFNYILIGLVKSKVPR